MPGEILLVEDNPADIHLTLQALAQHHLDGHVKIITDGEQAIHYIFGTGNFAARNRAEKPRVVLLDLRLPKVSGLDVLRRTRQHPHTRSLPVLVILAPSDRRRAAECRRLGADEVIVKSPDFELFEKAVAKVIPYLAQASMRLTRFETGCSSTDCPLCATPSRPNGGLHAPSPSGGLVYGGLKTQLEMQPVTPQIAIKCKSCVHHWYEHVWSRNGDTCVAQVIASRCVCVGFIPQSRHDALRLSAILDRPIEYPALRPRRDSAAA